MLIRLLTKSTNSWNVSYYGFCHLLNPSHPNIIIHILYTVLCTFTEVLTRRTCLTIKSFFSW